MDTKIPVNIIFIGHVDAGKSTICGRILYDTGMVDQRTVDHCTEEAQKLGRSSWYLAYLLDTSEEERQKGKTVEVGSAYFFRGNRKYTILDAPGHKNYVPNMIKGVSQADIPIVVISAKKGEFEAGFEGGGQTREHLILSKTVGSTKVIILVNKQDEGTVLWSEDRFREITDKLTPFLVEMGYLKSNVYWIPVSGYEGHYLGQRGQCSWYTGPTLVETLDLITPDPPGDKLLIPVLHSYKEGDKKFCFGKVESGNISDGDTVYLNPGGNQWVVTGLENNEGPITQVSSRELVTFRIRPLTDDQNILPGYVISKEILAPTLNLVVKVMIIDLPETTNLFSAGLYFMLHNHAAVEEAMVIRLLELHDKTTGKLIKRNPGFGRIGDLLIIHIRTTNPLVTDTLQRCPQLGKMSLRAGGKTIAIGKILGVQEPKLREN